MAKKPVRRVAIIMAGGSGERFWPLSRVKRPKQLLCLTSDRQTLLEEAVERILPLIPADNVYIATSRILAPAIRAAGLPIPPENVLAEPAKRNTTGCLAWAAAQLVARYPNQEISMAILTADHLIGEPARFRACVKGALVACEKDNALVTIGIRPTRPETGYGYIETGRRTRDRKGAVPVVRFREKPNLEQAEDFVASGRYCWNSGMFFWRVSTFLAQMEKASPDVAMLTQRMAEAVHGNQRRNAERFFEKLPDISIDYALLEKSPNVLMLEATFPWDDVGAWDALDRTRRKDADGNVVSGDPILVETRNSIVLNEAGGKQIAVGIVGVENLIVIVSKDSVLVVPKDKAQEVRLVARELKKRGAKQI